MSVRCRWKWAARKTDQRGTAKNQRCCSRQCLATFTTPRSSSPENFRMYEELSIESESWCNTDTPLNRRLIQLAGSGQHSWRASIGWMPRFSDRRRCSRSLATSPNGLIPLLICIGGAFTIGKGLLRTVSDEVQSEIGCFFWHIVGTH
jgi:hypothetical protein